MIPPVEVRMVRECTACICHHHREGDIGDRCKLFGCTERLKWNRNGGIGFDDDKKLIANSCIYNLYLQEYQELIDSGVIE